MCCVEMGAFTTNEAKVQMMSCIIEPLIIPVKEKAPPITHNVFYNSCS